MCRLCSDNDGEYRSCPDCSYQICFDVKGGDDLVRQAAVTSAGDLACIDCACLADAMEEQEYADE